jgi:hypothetical protein
MQELRKAALTLANLHELDRAWLMGRLDASERARLAPLVGELRSLGLAVDPQALRQAVEGKADGRVEAPRDEARALASAAPRAVFEALEREPDWLIALVLRARAWPWRAELLALLGAERRMRVERLARTTLEVRPRMMQSVLSALEERASWQP